MKKNLRPIVIISVMIAIASVAFLLSFTGFDVSLSSQDVVSGDQVFVSSDQAAIDSFINELNNAPVENQDAFGIGIFVDLKDSNGVVIPVNSNFLKVPLTNSFVNLNQNSLIATDGNPLDFAVIQLDFLAIAGKETMIQADVEYEVLSNKQVFLTGTAFGMGNTVGKQLNLKFDSGNKVGDALELSFENNEIPIQTANNAVFTNTLEVRITKVDAVVGSGFDTEQRTWTGSFPVYTLKFDNDDTKQTIRDFTGVAQILPVGGVP